MSPEEIISFGFSSFYFPKLTFFETHVAFDRCTLVSEVRGATRSRTSERGRDPSGRSDSSSHVLRARSLASAGASNYKEAYSALSTQVLMDKVLI